MTLDRLRSQAREAGVQAWLHARRLDGPPATIALNADEPVAIASLYKLPVAMVWADLVEADVIDAQEPLVLSRQHRAAGPTGVSMLLDDVRLSMRDAVRLMLAVSDNACADAVITRLGVDTIDTHLHRLGLTRTVVRQGLDAMQNSVLTETGSRTFTEAEELLADPDQALETSQYDAALASASTAADLTTALEILWKRTSIAHAYVRDAMARQAWRHRIASGFPHDDVRVSGKTGTLVQLRHEAAVVEFPYEHPIAVAVLTRSVRPERHQPRIDHLIGDLARTAVTALRMPADAPLRDAITRSARS